MNLIIDQGNSITKMALFRAGRLQNVYFYPKWDSTTVIDFLDVHEVDAAVVGAVMQCPDKAVLIVDAGTCVTYDLLTADGTFAGGNIAPGIRLRLRAMHEHTGKLPLIDDAGETPEIGFSTETAMRAGAVLGVAYEIEGYIARLNKVYPDLFVFLTGGDALKLAAKIKSRIFVDENLVLTGLNRILQENAKI